MPVNLSIKYLARAEGGKLVIVDNEMFVKQLRQFESNLIVSIQRHQMHLQPNSLDQIDTTRARSNNDTKPLVHGHIVGIKNLASERFNLLI